MKILRGVAPCWLASVAVVVVGCSTASPDKTPNAEAVGETESAAPGGRWVLLPPETGSHIRRRVWVSDSGEVTEPESSVQRTSAAEFEKVRRAGSSNWKGSN